MIKIWSAYDGQIVRTLEGHTAGLSDIAWSSDSVFLASASDDTTIRIWNVDLVCPYSSSLPFASQYALGDHNQNPQGTHSLCLLSKLQSCKQSFGVRWVRRVCADLGREQRSVLTRSMKSHYLMRRRQVPENAIRPFRSSDRGSFQSRWNNDRFLWHGRPDVCPFSAFFPLISLISFLRTSFIAEYGTHPPDNA
jgi:hypothetical protein